MSGSLGQLLRNLAPGQPLRTKERAAIDSCRRHLRHIAQNAGEKNIRVVAEHALEQIARILGERK